MNVVWSGVSRIPHGLLKNKRSTNKSSRYPCRPVFFFCIPCPSPVQHQHGGGGVCSASCWSLVGSRPHGRPAVALSMSLNTGSAWLRCDSGEGEGGGGLGYGGLRWILGDDKNVLVVGGNKNVLVLRIFRTCPSR